MSAHSDFRIPYSVFSIRSRPVRAKGARTPRYGGRQDVSHKRVLGLFGVTHRGNLPHFDSGGVGHDRKSQRG